MRLLESLKAWWDRVRGKGHGQQQPLAVLLGGVGVVMPGKLKPQISLVASGGSALTSLGSVAGSGGSSGGTSSDRFASLADNTWWLVEEAQDYGDPRSVGVPAPPSGDGAYSGMCIDDAHDTVLVFGGGHGDSASNAVWAWDIRNGGWTKQSPDDGAIFYALDDNTAAQGIDLTNFPGMWVPTRRPISRHTVDSLRYITHLGKMVAGGGALYTGNSTLTLDLWHIWGNDPEDWWFYDPVTTAWTYKGTTRNNAPNWPILAHVIYDGRYLWCASGVYAPVNDPNNPLASARVSGTSDWVWRVDPNDMTVLQKYSIPFQLSGDRACTYDSKRNAYVIYGGSDYGHVLWSCALDTGVWTNLSPASGPDLSGDGVAYDSTNDVIAVCGASGIWIYDFTTATWTQGADINLLNPNVRSRINGPVDGKFKYDAKRNVFFWGLTESGFITYDMWAYRWKKASFSVSLSVLGT